MGCLDWVRRIAAYLVATWCVWRAGDASYEAFRRDRVHSRPADPRNSGPYGGL